MRPGRVGVQPLLEQIKTNRFCRKERKSLRQQLFSVELIKVETGVYPAFAQLRNCAALGQPGRIRPGKGGAGRLRLACLGALHPRRNGGLEGVFALALQPAQQFDGAADAHAFVLPLDQPFQRVDVVLAVEPVSAVGALRGWHAVAALPGAQCIRF